MNVLLIGMAYMTLFERKVLAAMQDRMGPMRTGPKGILQPIADGIKLLGKEDLIPRAADKPVFYFAPLVIFITSIVSVAVIPFGGTIHLFGRDINLFIADLNVGALFVLAFSSVGVYGIILGGMGVRESLFASGRVAVGGAGGFLRNHLGPVPGWCLPAGGVVELARHHVGPAEHP